MTNTIRLLGHTFALMDDEDFRAFAGAPEGSYIWYGEDDVVLIWTPADGKLTEIPIDPEGTDYDEHTWRKE